MDLKRVIAARARELGFSAFGVARADEPLGDDYARYRAFVDAGMHGDMEYLARNAEVRERVDGEGILAGARSVICVGRAYQRVDDGADPPTAQTIARYARGPDYHNFVRKKVQRLAAFVRGLGTPEAPVHARPLVDDAPILERAWAARAGLGFVGKNGLLIAPGLGSMVLLGEVVTTLPLPADAPMSERCGSCTRCLDACPTNAFPKPFVLDARRCISYLTIESRAPIPEALRPAIGEHLFGCDDCQTVCPFNASTRQRDEGASDFRPLERWSTVALAELLDLDDARWRPLSQGSPVYRATSEGLARNAAIVLGNRRDRAALGPLRAAHATHASELVRDAAGWAIARIEAAPP